MTSRLILPRINGPNVTIDTCAQCVPIFITQCSSVPIQQYNLHCEFRVVEYFHTIFILKVKWWMCCTSFIKNSMIRTHNSNTTWITLFNFITLITLRELQLPVRQRITYKISPLTYKAINGMVPQYLADLLHCYIPTRYLRSSSKNLLRIPKSNLKSYGERSFQVAAPKLWNTLPEDIKISTSFNDFKVKIKTLLFEQAFC